MKQDQVYKIVIRKGEEIKMFYAGFNIEDCLNILKKPETQALINEGYSFIITKI